MFNNQTVLITGGDKGIGKAIALAFAQNNANIFFTYYRDEASARETKAELLKLTKRADYFQLDLSAPEARAAFIERYLKEIGKLDILVNNAGSLYDTLFAKAEMEKWWQIFELIFNGSVELIKGLLDTMMISDNGRIINIASIAGLIGIPGQSNYSCAKSALIMFSKVLGKELARLGVTVNVIGPGYIETPMIAGFSDEQRKQFKKPSR